jgi:hypothetical protein
MVIHCLWVVGKGKGKGYASRLIEECLADARTQKTRGVAMLTSDLHWLSGKSVFGRNGFTQLDSAPPSFQLMVQQFRRGPKPTLPKNWEERARAFGPGLTVLRTAQCPYVENASNAMLELAEERGIQAKVAEFTTAREVQQRSPSAYGAFGSVLDGRFFAYYYLQPKDFDKLMLEHQKGNRYENSRSS